MRKGYQAIARAAALLVLALAIATPSAAQFGGLKKKVKAAVSKDAEPAEVAEANDGGADGGVVVLTPDVVERLIAGLKAGQAERDAAAKADTPFGRHQRAAAAYKEAKSKCEAGQRTFVHRMSGNEKLMDKYNYYVQKMAEAQGRGQQELVTAYNDSAMAMQDPACVVKEPQQPDGYWETQRSLDYQAEQKAIKTSGLSPSEYSMALERADAVLRGGTVAGDLSASEKEAVSKRATELKPLLGIRDPEPETPAPAVPATPAPQPAAAAVPAGSNAMAACAAQNAQKHEQRIQALGERAQKEQEAGNMAAVMAIADTLQQLQMAGCTGAR
jgi:hypothetical protein